MMPNGQDYSKRVRARALTVAARIAGISSIALRTQLARAVCLDAVRIDPRFPEVRFLRDCGVLVNLSEGVALRAKKTRYTVRVKSGKGAWGERCSRNEKQTECRRRKGIGVEQVSECEAEEEYPFYHPSKKEISRFALNWLHEMA